MNCTSKVIGTCITALIVVGTVGKGVLEKAFKNSVNAIEARNGAAREISAA